MQSSSDHKYKICFTGQEHQQVIRRERAKSTSDLCQPPGAAHVPGPTARIPPPPAMPFLLLSALSTHQVIQTPSLPQAVTLFTKRGSTSMGSGIRIWVSWGHLVQLSQHLCVALRQWRKLGGRHYGNITVKPLSSLLVSWANHCNNHCALLRHYTSNRQPLVGLDGVQNCKLMFIGSCWFSECWKHGHMTASKPM